MNIASLDETDRKSEIAILYETVSENPDTRYPNGVPRESAPYMLEVAVFGGASPIKKRFKLFISPDGLLQMEGV